MAVTTLKHPSVDVPPPEEIEKFTIAGSPQATAMDDSENDNCSDEEDFKMNWRIWLACASFQLGYMSDVFAISMASSILQYINRDIGPDPNYAWMATAQILGVAVMAPSIGRLSDIFGRRNFLLAGNVLAAVGCVVAATARDVNTVIGASAVIGIGSAMHQLALSCLAEIVPKRLRFVAYGVFQTALAPAAAFAPVIGLAMVSHGSWRGAYWLPFGLDVASLVLVFFFYKPVNQYIKVEGKTRWQQLLDMDWIGNLLLVAGLVLLLVGISIGGTRYPWASAPPITLIVVGVLALVVLGLWEAYADLETPIFPKAIFANKRTFTVVLAGLFLVGMLYYSTTVLWPQQVAMLYTQDPITIGLYASAVGIAGSIAGFVSGWAFTKIGHARWVLTATVTGMAVCAGCQAVVSPGSNVASTALAALVGIFVSCATIISTIMVQLGVPHDFIGVSTGLIITSRSIGGSIGTTIYSSILGQRFRENLVPKVATPLAMAGVEPSKIGRIIQALLTGSSDNEVLNEVSPEILGIASRGIKLAFAASLRTVYLISIAFGGVAIICVAFSANVDHLMTKKVEIRLKADVDSENVTQIEKGR